MTTLAAQTIIVGAGPAGASAAYFLAQAGVDVLLVDKAAFPRDKSCGDALGFYAGQMLQEMGLIEWVSDFSRIERILLSSPNGNFACIPLPTDIAHSYVVPRLELDAKLVETAVTAGARLQQGLTVRGMDVLSADRVHLQGERDGQTVTLQTPLVIAADGGLVSFTRRLGLADARAKHVAARAYFEGDIGDAQQIEIHWERAIRPGYGWIVALGTGWVNVGIGCRTADLKRLPTNLRGMLDIFVQNNPHARERLKHATRVGPIVSHPLRASAQDIMPLADHVLVAGEAAGLVNPLTGEGIAAAMVSGKIAANHARRALESGDFSAQALAAYRQVLHQRFDPLHRSARLAQRALGVSWLLNRSIQRASHDPVYARQLAAVIIGRDIPAELLKPQIAIRALLG